LHFVKRGSFGPGALVRPLNDGIDPGINPVYLLQAGVHSIHSAEITSTYGRGNVSSGMKDSGIQCMSTPARYYSKYNRMQQVFNCLAAIDHSTARQKVALSKR
jgi:hypothetical protein